MTATNTVPAGEVLTLLRKVGNGESMPTLARSDIAADPDRFLFHDVAFLVEGYTIVVYFDGGEWDYIDHVITPDGRRGKFDDWAGESAIEQPDMLLQSENHALWGVMVDAFMRAK